MRYYFRENLRNELDFQGVTVKELSARTGIPIATIECYLGARETIPSVEAAYKIAQALKVSVEFLVVGNTVSPKKKNKLCREAQEIINLVENLNQEQCSAILKLANVLPCSR
jgi:transcriptional regulator with XRE-family HTH domain